MHTGLKMWNIRKHFQLLHLVILSSDSILIQEVFFTLDLISWHIHVGSFFTNEDQKKGCMVVL